MTSKLRTPIAFLASIAWLIAIWVSVVEPKGGLASLLNKDPNAIGDFLAGTFAPLAFFWFVIAYWQQSDELRLATKEMQRQANSIEENTRHAARDILLRYAELIISDMQFKSLQLSLSIRRDTWVGDYSAKINESRDGYFKGDRDSPLRRLVLLMKRNPTGLSWSYQNNYVAKQLIDKILENYRSLLRLADNSDTKEKALLSFYEHGLYGDYYAALCLVLDQETGFLMRAKVNNLDDIVM